ncbi:MAG: PaaI family thioesterase [bacterium]|nr:PaaI family thioesterase [bacterium]
MSNTIDNPIEYAKNIVGQEPLSRLLGITVEEVREGYARCSLTIKPEHLNAVERSHGAVISAVAGQALSIASNSTGVMALVINVNLNFISSASEGERIFSESSSLNIGKKVSVWKVEVRGKEDRLIASGEGTFYHK